MAIFDTQWVSNGQARKILNQWSVERPVDGRVTTAQRAG